MVSLQRITLLIALVGIALVIPPLKPLELTVVVVVKHLVLAVLGSVEELVKLGEDMEGEDSGKQFITSKICRKWELTDRSLDSELVASLLKPGDK